MRKVNFKYKKNDLRVKLSKVEEEEILERVFDSIIARNEASEKKELQQNKA